MNIDRGRAAQDATYATAAKINADLVFLQEPNKAISSRQGLVMDKEGDVAMICRNKSCGIIAHKSYNGYIKVIFENWVAYNVYISPNISVQVFKQSIDEIMEGIRREGKDVIIVGDLNAKSPLWGSNHTDEKWIASLDMEVKNDGCVPTFVREIAEPTQIYYLRY
ncbi:uncharacterized protein [Leptinotarsa decemlineata]|uniref:uncharacterized protein n=1 Tax=Leptinotarsa decemlineata TaxID=7539 RepID=UPI003D304600